MCLAHRTWQQELCQAGNISYLTVWFKPAIRAPPLIAVVSHPLTLVNPCGLLWVFRRNTIGRVGNAFAWTDTATMCKKGVKNCCSQRTSSSKLAFDGLAGQHGSLQKICLLAARMCNPQPKHFLFLQETKDSSQTKDVSDAFGSNSASSEELQWHRI